MLLRLANCELREWRDGDQASIVAHANDRAVWRNLRDLFPHPYTRADAKEWVRRMVRQSPPTHFAIVAEGAAVGGIGFRPGQDVFRRSAEIGFWLGRAFWGRGIATEAVRAVTEYAFDRFDLCRMHAGVFAWNPASMRVLEKAGYTREARLRQSVTKDGLTIDQVVYARVRNDPPVR